MFYLKKTSPLFLRICDVKRFQSNEYHITRIYNYSVLILMMDGVLQFYEDGILHTLYPGDYYIQRAGLLQEGMNIKAPNALPPEQPPVYFYMEFRGAEYMQEVGGLPVSGRFSEKRMLPLISEFENAFFDSRKLNSFALNSYLYRVLSELYDECFRTVPEKQWIPDIMHMVKRYIDSAYVDINSVDEIAKKFGYSRDHLNRLFAQVYQTSISCYLRQRRMKEAMQLLQNTDMTLLQISQAIGYRDYSAFYRAFLSYYHVNPKSVSEGETQ